MGEALKDVSADATCAAMQAARQMSAHVGSCEKKKVIHGVRRPCQAFELMSAWFKIGHSCGIAVKSYREESPHCDSCE